MRLRRTSLDGVQEFPIERVTDGEERLSRRVAQGMTLCIKQKTRPGCRAAVHRHSIERHRGRQKVRDRLRHVEFVDPSDGACGLELGGRSFGDGGGFVRSEADALDQKVPKAGEVTGVDPAHRLILRSPSDSRLKLVSCEHPSAALLRAQKVMMQGVSGVPMPAWP